ncbi:MAG: alpha/beta hydrolase [Enterobacterales bacterium endosymbiont of Blomia tropicalis]|uniref:alpha/beta hydrolase n=1 Tax=Mixta mediterraneensis TaxID=2758443 RepID=UPI0025A7FCAE|nr:alpha/beta hydrolase [Mixta mediterraneensis]MDL4915188.1 alpha/beta hydrolase [Mixta mediterraneensis]
MQSTEMPQEVDTEVERSQKLYFRSHTTIFSSRYDPRFQYCLYVPPAFDNDRENYRLVVAMHGTGRSMTHYRDAFAEFARYNRCVVLAPLFPVGPLGDGNSHGFKYIVEQDIRYDTVLLNMIEEVSASLNYDFGRFLLFGYSGGGHFVHRFFYLHPEKLLAVSIGAPGSVTLLDDKKVWWVGVQDFEKIFKKQLNYAAMREVAVQLVVGKVDIETWEITHKPGGKYYQSGCNDAGTTRIDRNTALLNSLRSHGINAVQNIVPNVGHDGMKVLDDVKDFFLQIINNQKGQPK